MAPVRTALLAMLLACPRLSAASPLSIFQASWPYRALMLQQHMDLNAPLASIMLVHTHNSYNAAAYAHDWNYLDPNQQLSVADQLAIGVRSLEYDVHYTWSTSGWSWQQHLLLCHAQEQHIGCLPTDRTFEEGLSELSSFLRRPGNEQELVVLYIEDFISGHYAEAVAAIADALGDLVYRPAITMASCQGIPMHISKHDLLRQHKQLLIMGGAAVCASHAGWETWAFAGVGDYVQDSYPSADPGAYRDGRCDQAFSREFQASHWVRVQEDRTRLAQALGKGQELSVADIGVLTGCGVNIIGLDQLKLFDERYSALIWSWDFAQPPATQPHGCALEQSSGRFTDADCASQHRFACRTATGWTLSEQAGVWQAGNAACPAATVFSAPVNRYENQAVVALMAADAGGLWLNYAYEPSRQTWAPGPAAASTQE